MIDFIVTGLPRSGTTWAANWLTTDNTLCIHDPLYKYYFEDLDAIESNKKLGISCTGLWRTPELLANHPAKKLIIHRSLDEVNDSLAIEMGVNKITEEQAESLKLIDGMHIQFPELFNPLVAKEVYENLLDKPFDAERHAYLVEMNVQPNFNKVTFDRAALDDFRQRINK
jgi:hypothetical protein